MTTGVWILGDRLDEHQAALAACADRRTTTPVIAIESLGFLRDRPYHRQKLVLVWSAMRHFVAALRSRGWRAQWREGEAFETVLRPWIAEEGIDRLLVMTPTDRPFLRHLLDLQTRFPCTLELLPCNHFIWSEAEVLDWLRDRKRPLLEDFYRAGRRRWHILMDGDGPKAQPLGDRWNFDADNRKPPKAGLMPPPPLTFEPDAITQAVIEKVRGLGDRGIATWGDLTPFPWAVTRSQALAVLENFIDHRLRDFGPYQDAMVTGQDTLWHALLSPYLNLGLLRPWEVVQAIAAAHRDRGDLPLASVEGCIRQILGWREYMRGLYLHLSGPADAPTAYAQSNWFNHQRPLPAFFWTGDTPCNCLRQTLTQVRRTGYGHHIQRLMVLGNFATIAGINPQAVESWFHSAFIDGYDWVMQTNVLGMGLFADGGRLATKPYAASGNYINRMGDYCKGCAYDPKQRTGPRACPFNVFYWDFLIRHEGPLRSHGRMALVLKHLDKFTEADRAAIADHAAAWWDGQP